MIKVLLVRMKTLQSLNQTRPQTRIPRSHGEFWTRPIESYLDQRGGQGRQWDGLYPTFPNPHGYTFGQALMARHADVEPL